MSEFGQSLLFTALSYLLWDSGRKVVAIVYFLVGIAALVKGFTG